MDMPDDSLLSGANSAWVEAQLQRFLKDPASVSEDWRDYFSRLEDGVVKAAASPSWARSDWPKRLNGEATAPFEPGLIPALSVSGAAATAAGDVRAATMDSIRALMLIRAYRVRGHMQADLDPLKLAEIEPHPELDPASYGFTDDDWDRPIFIDHVLGLEAATLREIMEILQRTYCSTIGVEFMHIAEPDEKSWIQERIEGRHKEVSFTEEGKKAIFAKIVEAEVFEHYLDTKYTGTKRFGLEGGEAIVPALEGIIKRAGHLGVEEIVIGMSHRGRLNVLANVMQKPFRAVFNEFQGGAAHPEDVEGTGDVKYHLGTSADRTFDGNKVHLSLTPNPSHLEAVDPVVLGKVRAKQAQRGDTDRGTVMPVLLHGDAAFSGQGVVAECFGLSQLRGYRVGGTIHLVINNQIGFTTMPTFSRSSRYPSDMAKFVQAPVFHVNGDDPEAVAHVCKIAVEFRQQFKKDVVVDVMCYRRHGHNESDEPMFTQPIMYRRIKEQPTVKTIYGKRLMEEGLLSKDDIAALEQKFRDQLDGEFASAESYKPNKADWLEGRWSGIKVAEDAQHRGVTEEDEETLRRLIEALTTVPEGFNVHRTLKRVMDRRREMLESGENIDWATAEALAFGSLLTEGFHVRLSGQDSGRGTFSHRHAVFVDQKTEETYVPLADLGGNAGRFEVIDSSLSEFAVLGFEYGYSTAEPNALVLWEAQFGDFANGAQVMFDTFIASGERKWLRMSGLTVLLPHGWEGQGPEHSSARLERFLQLSAENNWQVANVTTPANYFHILRRQMHRDFRKPLILMTPKSLLRHKLCISSLRNMGPGTSFHRVMQDHLETEPDMALKLQPDNKISRVVLCSGKVYYDLFEEREKRGLDDVYLARIEQLYPFPANPLRELLQRFPKARVVWCQEEPENMGAWSYIRSHIESLLDEMKRPQRLPYAGRMAAAAPATGIQARHVQQQARLVDLAFTL